MPRDSDVYPTARMRSPTRGNSCMASSCPHPLPLLLPPLCPHANQRGVRQTMTTSAAQRSQSESHTRPQSLAEEREREMINQSRSFTCGDKHHATAVVKADDGDDRAPFTVRCVEEPSGRGAPSTDIRAWPPICHLIFQGNSYSCRQGS